MMDPRTFQSLHVSRVSMITQGGFAMQVQFRPFAEPEMGGLIVFTM